MKLVSELQKNLLLVNKIFYSKNYKFLMLVVFLFPNYSFGQIANYVNNGGFEDIYSCSFPNNIFLVKKWRSIDSLPTGCVFFSKCSNINNIPLSGFTYQFSRSGLSHIGLTLYCTNPCNYNGSRSYVRNRLKQNLQPGKSYCVKFYVNITNNSSHGIDKIGAYFGDNFIDTITKPNLPLTYLVPQIQNPNNNVIIDTLNWTLITGTFVATGNEKHLVLGNFFFDGQTNTSIINSSTNYTVTDVLIDDVSCIPIDLPAYAAAGNDIWAIPGNTLYLGRPQDIGIDEACMWYKLPNITTAIDTAAGITVTVSITTNTYIVRQEICGNVKWDTVVVHASGLGLVSSSGVENSNKIYPNPANDILNIEFVTLSGVEASNTKYSIINSLGQIVREEVLRQAQQPNGTFTATINTKDLANGVYLLNLSSRGTRDLKTDSSGIYTEASRYQDDNALSVSKRFVIYR
jgi:hypothetical protein